jgi:sulfate transport system ATP-binding protein
MEGLVLQAVNAGYNGITVIKNISFEVKSGELLILMGVSGAGKTTLLKTILGIVHPESGTITLNTRNITSLPLEQRNIAYLSQDYGLFPHMNVHDNIAYGLRVRAVSKEEQNQVVTQLLEKFGLQGFGKKTPDQLSGGQKQRVGLARAMAIKPDLILLDEPLSNIDQVTKFEVASYLKSVFELLNIPIIFVTHQYEDAEFFQGRVIILVDGVIEQMGTYQELIQNPKNNHIKRLLTPISSETGKNR